MTIRILRTLEYTYHDTDIDRRSVAELMADDVASWSVGATATVRHRGVTIKSSTMLPETVEEGGPDRWFEAVEVTELGHADPVGYAPGELKERT